MKFLESSWFVGFSGKSLLYIVLSAWIFKNIHEIAHWSLGNFHLETFLENSSDQCRKFFQENQSCWNTLDIQKYSSLQKLEISRNYKVYFPVTSPYGKFNLHGWGKRINKCEFWENARRSVKYCMHVCEWWYLKANFLLRLSCAVTINMFHGVFGLSWVCIVFLSTPMHSGTTMGHRT